MDEFYNSQRIKHTNLSELLKPSVWVINVSGIVKGRKQIVSATGFCVRNDGLVMTCAHTVRNMGGIEIKARRLTEENFETAKIEFMSPKWDLALLKINNAADCSVVEFANDGSIWEGEPLLHVGNILNFVGSYLLGHACFPCVDNVPPIRSNETCGVYDSTALERTPNYRVMGDVWNRLYFERNIGQPFLYEKSLVPSVPIIQCNGINAGPGCSGGPVVNMEGRVVGMLVGDADGYDIAVHLSALKLFLTNATESEDTSTDTSKKQRTC